MTVVHRWLAEPLPRPVAQALERLAAAPGVRRVAVMPDVRLAIAVAGGDIEHAFAGVQVDGVAQQLADELQAHADARIVAGSPGGALAVGDGGGGGGGRAPVERRGAAARSPAPRSPPAAVAERPRGGPRGQGSGSEMVVRGVLA
jgi:hypothetical protein